jgi:hypothetical protein
MDEVVINILELLLVTDLVDQVRPIETRLEESIVSVNLQALHYVILDFDGSCGCEAEKGDPRVLVLQEIEVQVVFSEVLAPIRHAVHLIDDEAVNFIFGIELVNHAEQAWGFHQPLGGQVDQFVLALPDLVVELPKAAFFFLRLRPVGEGA